MKGSPRSFTNLLRLEAVGCFTLALAALNLPGGLIRLLAQAPVGSLVAWMDVVALVRALGWVLLAVAALHTVASFTVERADVIAWGAALLRVALGVARWRLLVQGPGVAPWLGWADLILAMLTVLALIGARVPRAKAAVAPHPALQRVKVGAGIGAGFAVLLLAFASWWQLFRVGPAPEFKSDEEHFKYGSVGNARSRGLPLYIFEALPEAFPDKLPGGWASLGFVFEPGHAEPVGFAQRRVGFPGLTPNCALCHSGVYRTAPSAPVSLAPGAPAESLDFHGFLRFLFACGEDPRFTNGELLAKIRARHPLSAFTAVLYQHVLLPAMAEGLKLGRGDFKWMERQPAAGPGRMDAGAMLKFNILRLPYDGTLSTSDFRPLWNQRAGYANFHRWSGGGQELREENLLAAALFLFLQPRMLDAASYGRMTNYFATLRPPKYPLPVNESLARQGEAIFRRECAACHRPDGAEFNHITPLSRLGVDGAYLEASTPEFLWALAALNKPPFRFRHQQLTDGYVNSSLEGTWLRGPYLHNGSVPTVWDLLQPPVQRPVVFPRGGSVLDATRLGFLTSENGPGPLFLFDTRQRGNGNAGHAYGTELPDADKHALIEYLKTL